MERALKKLVPITISFIFLLCGCSSIQKNRNPVNEIFPTVTGKSLEKKISTLPGAFGGEHTVVLIGYKQNAQFDIDRWLLGLTDSGVKAAIYEVPTVVGMIPGMIAEKIDSGMRSGIPKPLWASVVTVYGNDAEKLERFTGNERPLNARVLLLDQKGKVVFFHDRGYGIPYLKALISLIPKKYR